MVQKPGGKIDSAHITFRKGIMYKPDIVKPGITALDCLLTADPQVIELARLSPEDMDPRLSPKGQAIIKKSDALILIANNWHSIQLAEDFPGSSLEN